MIHNNQDICHQEKFFNQNILIHHHPCNINRKYQIIKEDLSKKKIKV